MILEAEAETETETETETESDTETESETDSVQNAELESETERETVITNPTLRTWLAGHHTSTVRSASDAPRRHAELSTA